MEDHMVSGTDSGTNRSKSNCEIYTDAGIEASCYFTFWNDKIRAVNKK